MGRLTDKPAQRLVAALLGALVLGLLFHVSPLRSALDRDISDFGFATLKKTPPADVAVVEIDAKSLHAIGEWPWSRRLHAELIQRIDAAGADRIVFDVDFSVASSDPLADARFAQALAGASAQVTLPSFWQALSDDRYQLVLTQPHPMFQPHTDTGLVDVTTDSDGLVRRLVHEKISMSGRHRSLSAALLPRVEVVAGQSYPVDFAFDLSYVPKLSFQDVLTGEFAPELLKDRVVFVGNSALELGDQVAVPAYQTLPGVYVQVLSYLTLQSGLTAASWLVDIVLIALVLTTFLVTFRWPWKHQLALLFTQSFLLLSSVWFAQHAHGVQLTVALPLFVSAVLHACNLLLTLEAQTLLLVGSRLSAQRQAALIDSLFANSVDGIVIVDDNLRIEHANESACEIFNIGKPIVGLYLPTFIPRIQDATALRAILHASSQGSRVRWTANRDANERLLDVAVSEIDVPGHTLLIARDVTEQEAQAERLEYDAAHDALTGLVNRRSLNQELANMVACGPTTVLMVDLDRFKHINDTLGHAVGDDVLRIVASRMEERVPEGALVARFGGDEFCIALKDMQDGAAQMLAEVVLEWLRAPISVAGVGLEVGASIGIASAPEHADDVAGLLQKADIALYRAKQSRANVETFSAQNSGPSVRQLQIAGALRQAIEASRLRMHYQPKYSVRSGDIVGVEALVRWHDPVLGEVSPEEFVSLAEETDLIHPLTEWTLKQSIADIHELRDAGYVLPCAINLSVRHFRDLSFASVFDRLCQSEKVKIGTIELEITESALMHDPQQAVEVIKGLRQAGARLAVDDFGTGYSSLAYLKQFEVDCLKIDRCFVDEITANAGDYAIVRSIIQLAHDLGMTVVAEGVENGDQLALLNKLGCDVVQGFYLCKPISFDALQAVLSQQATPGGYTALAG